jgi:hypothetical protein
MRRRPAALALVGWTLFVWTTRIFNIWGDADLDTGEKLGRTGLALSFTLLAAAAIVALWHRAAHGDEERGRARARLVAVGALAGWTVAVWVVRDIRIVAADHDLGFTLVHVVLGVVSLILAAWAWREATRTAPRRVPV